MFEDWVIDSDVCFQKVSEHKSWFDARDMCNSLGGDLAVIHNEKLMNVTIEHTHEDGQDSWIGLKKDEQGDGENDIVLIDSNLEFLATNSLFTISSNH